MLAFVYQKPLIGVNHLEGHVLSVLPGHPTLEPPFLALVASGGHTELVLVKKYGVYNVLGKTLDDACGEAFDKVAKILELGYPGGPAIDKLATRGKSTAVDFPRPALNDGWDFSFSGLKTSVIYYLKDNPGMKATKKRKADVCASFQAAVVDVLVTKTLKAAEHHNVKHIVVTGGVAANTALRNAFLQRGKKHKIHLASPLLCTDNAVMIAVAGYYKYMKSSHKKFKPRLTEVDSTLSIRNWMCK